MNNYITMTIYAHKNGTLESASTTVTIETDQLPHLPDATWGSLAAQLIIACENNIKAQEEAEKKAEEK